MIPSARINSSASLPSNNIVGPAAVLPNAANQYNQESLSRLQGPNARVLHRLQTSLLVKEAIGQVIDSYLQTQSPSGKIGYPALTKMICNSIDFTRELAQYYVHLHEY